jgi:glutathione S-transferase
MKLYLSPSSPFVRKTRAAMLELGLEDKIEEVICIPWDANSHEAMQNPTGKVPALITDDGVILFDSPVICEYLDSLSDQATLFPPIGPARWDALRRQALSDALLDAMIARRIEGNRPGDANSEYWVDRHWSAVQRCLDEMEQTVPATDKPIDIGDIAIAVALAQLLFRFGDQDWRPGRPNLTSWFEEIVQRPSLAKTHPVDHERAR